MYIPTNKDEFLDLPDQAIFEARDMLSAIGSEGVECEIGDHVGGFETLETVLVGLHADMRDNRHAFDGQPLPDRDLLTRFRSQISSADVLETLNKVQRNGF